MAETKEAGFKLRGIKKIFYYLLISGLILGLSWGVNAYSSSGTAGTCICGNGNTELGGSDTDACWDCKLCT